VLIAFEPESYGYFSSEVRHQVAGTTKALGAQVRTLDVGFTASHVHLPKALLAQIPHTDVVIFLSRLGDQLRFSELPQGPKFVVCFAFNETLMRSSFGTAHYQAFCEAKAAVDTRLFAAREITITCPAGTQITGSVKDAVYFPKDTTAVRFPMSVFSPVPSAGFSGQVALKFLTGTGSQYYTDYTVFFDDYVFAIMERGRLQGFEGSAADVAKAHAHYDRVAEMFGVERNFVHSWHAGLHPGCGFPWDLRANDRRWGGAAFGNPRILHFHTCGTEPPGEISWNVFDPTIQIDGLAVWENGTFHLERLGAGPRILADYPCAAEAFAHPDHRIGLQ